MKMSRELQPIKCEICDAPTNDQWGGYCHDCDAYMEAVIAERISRAQVKEMGTS